MLRDFRHAIRALRSWRFGAITAALTLAVGIGTVTSMYALARMALTSTIPDVEDLPSLGRIYASSRTLAIERSPLSLKDVTLLAAASSFDSVGAYISGSEGEMTIGGQPVPISVAQVSAGLFPAMRGHAASGSQRLAWVRRPSRCSARGSAPSCWTRAGSSGGKSRTGVRSCARCSMAGSFSRPAGSASERSTSSPERDRWGV